MIAKIIFTLLTSYFCAKAILTGKIVDIGLFVFSSLIPFFIIFPNIYFLSFLSFRAVFDVVTKYNLPIPNPNAPTMTLFIIIYFGVLIFNKHALKIVLSHPFLKKFNFFFILFLVPVLLSLIHTTDFFTSMSDLMRLLSVALLVNYSTVYMLRTPKGKEKIIKVLIVSSLVPCALGLYQLLSGRGLYLEGFHRVFGSFVHPNVFGEYLFVIFFISIFLHLDKKFSAGHKKLVMTYTLIVLLLIFNTFTRNVWIALFFSSVIYVLFGQNMRKKIAYLFGGLIFLSALFPFIGSRFLDIFNPSNNNESNSWEWRLELWKKTFEHVFEHPFIGHGIGSFEVQALVPAHNDYLRLSFEVGFVGLFFYLLLITMILGTAFKKMRDRRKTPLARKGSLGVMCLFLGLMIISAADNLARSTVVLMYAFVIAAIFLAETNPQDNYENITDQ